MKYTVLIEKKALEFLNILPEKRRRVVKDALKKLGDSPYPDSGSGDKEKLLHRGESLFRIHMGRSCAAFYRIYDEKREVKILKIMTIEQAHKEYGKL